jgi:hypothetical protein
MNLSGTFIDQVLFRYVCMYYLFIKFSSVITKRCHKAWPLYKCMYLGRQAQMATKQAQNSCLVIKIICFQLGSCQLQDVAAVVMTRIVGHYPHRNQVSINAFKGYLHKKWKSCLATSCDNDRIFSIDVARRSATKSDTISLFVYINR